MVRQLPLKRFQERCLYTVYDQNDQNLMDINQQKEQFSITYIRTIAAVAGYSLYRPEVDNDSVDLGIVSRGGTGKILSPRLEI
ncbi:MAG: hypothetical protein PUP91_06680 [Rhizonema sp. PD37]|nr:hypothetical protein [Rhizonema sp. PD37]